MVCVQHQQQTSVPLTISQTSLVCGAVIISDECLFLKIASKYWECIVSELNTNFFTSVWNNKSHSCQGHTNQLGRPEPLSNQLHIISQKTYYTQIYIYILT